jgi:hypothetical protein
LKSAIKKRKGKRMLVKKIGKNEETQRNKEVESAVTRYVDTKAEIDKLNEQLKVDKEIIATFGKNELEESEASTITLSCGDSTIKLTFGFDVRVSNVETLEKILGERFQDLVTVKTECKPDTKLKQMALNDDGLKECLVIKEKAPTFKVEG